MTTQIIRILMIGALVCSGKVWGDEPLEGIWETGDGSIIKAEMTVNGMIRGQVVKPNLDNPVFREFVTGDTVFEVVPHGGGLYHGWIADMISSRDPFTKRQVELSLSHDKFWVSRDARLRRIDDRKQNRAFGTKTSFFPYDHRTAWVCHRSSKTLDSLAPPMVDRNSGDQKTVDTKKLESPTPKGREIVLAGTARNGLPPSTVTWQPRDADRRLSIQLSIDRAGGLFDTYRELGELGQLKNLQKEVTSHRAISEKAEELAKTANGPKGKARKMAQAELRKIRKATLQIESGVLNRLDRDQRPLTRELLRSHQLEPVLVVKSGNREKSYPVNLLDGLAEIEIDLPANESQLSFEIRGPMMKGTTVMMTVANAGDISSKNYDNGDAK